jgi:hypothetical protein
MFGRTIQLDVVKKNVKGEAAPMKDAEYDASVYVAAAVVAARQIAFITVSGIAAYMVFDTTRKIAVNRLSK